MHSCDNTVHCTFPTIAAGDSVTVTLVVTVPSTSTLAKVVNTATISSQNDANTANNSATVSTDIGGDLTISKSVTPDPSAAAGSLLTYTLTVTNNGPGPGLNAVLTDMIPVGTTFVSVSAGCSPGLTGTSITCNYASLPASGSPVSVTLVVKIPSSTPATTPPIYNLATVTSANDPNMDNNTASVSTTVVPQADLSITKTGPTHVFPGDTVTYQISVANLGPSDAQNVQVTDTLPSDPDLTFVSATTPCLNNAGILTCSLGAMASGASPTVLTVTETLSDSSNSTGFINSAQVSSATPDPSADNNSSSVTTSVDQVGCPVAGDVHGNQDWTMLVGTKKVNVHVEVDGDCDLNKKTGGIFLHHGHVKLHVDGFPGSNDKVIDAKQDGKHNDITRVAITATGDATIQGIWNGTQFTVYLHDGGKGNKNDTVRVVYNGLDTTTLSTKHGNVHIDSD